MAFKFMEIKTSKIFDKDYNLVNLSISERVASALDTVRDLGMLCEQSGYPHATIIERMDEKVIKAGHGLEGVYDAFGKDLVLSEPLFYKGTIFRARAHIMRIFMRHTCTTRTILRQAQHRLGQFQLYH